MKEIVICLRNEICAFPDESFLYFIVLPDEENTNMIDLLFHCVYILIFS